MPQGDKRKYTDKQKRMERHIEEGYEQSGVGKEESERRAWATVNAQTGGGNKPGGSGREQREHVERGAQSRGEEGLADPPARGECLSDRVPWRTTSDDVLSAHWARVR